MKKWAWTFGDYLHEGAKTATPSNWNEVPPPLLVSFLIQFSLLFFYF